MSTDLSTTSPDAGELARVFGERDASRRLKAIAQLYAPDATLYDGCRSEGSRGHQSKR